MPDKPTYEELEQQVRELEQADADCREKAREALIESDEKYKQLSDASFEAVFLSEKGICKGQNKSAEKMFGYTSEEAFGRMGTDWIHPEYHAIVGQNMLSGNENPYEVIARRKDGSTFPCEIQGRMVIEKGNHIRITALRDITERRQAEEKLRESHRQLLTVMDNLSELVYISDIQTHELLFVNDHGLKLFGGKDIIGEKCWKIFQKNMDGPCPFCNSDKLITAEGQPAGMYQSEFQNTVNGKWYDCQDQAIPWTDGRLVRMEIAIDITKRKLLFAALKESEERLKLALDSVSDAIWDWRVDTGEVYFSPRWYTMLGYEPYELPQAFETWRTLLHAEDLLFSEQTVFHYLKSGKSFEIEFRMKTRDGHWRWILARGKTVEKDQHGKPLRMLGTHMDITERKQAENEMIEQKKNAERYLNMSGVMFIGLDLDGKVTIANNYSCKVLECDKNEIIGQDWFDTFIPESIRKDAHQVFKQLSGGEMKRAEYFENKVVSKRGKEKIIAWHNTFITDDGGAIVSVLSAGEDITEKRILEDQLQKAQKMESIGNLAGGIAHDFNNLLFPIIGLSEMLLEDLPQNSLAHQNVREILKAGERGSDLVKQILAFSRQSDRQKIPMRVQKILQEVLRLSRSIIPSDIELAHDIQPNCGLILADATQIHQIAMNLITNAYHALESSGGTIGVHLSEAVLREEDLIGRSIQAGRYAMLKISDTGCGISPDIKDKIFEPYFTTKEKGKGTGLGLAVVYGIVREHGGEIQVESHLGKGTTIIVWFPLIEDIALEDGSVQNPERFETGKERIFLIDDDEAIINLEKQMLERLGYSVVSRVNSLEALEAFKSTPGSFDIVITDMTMPGMTGDQLSKEILAIRPDIPIIICTGYSERMNKEKATAIGVKDLLMKPVVKSDMAQMVRRLLDEANSSNKQ